MDRWEPLGVIADTEYTTDGMCVEIEQDGNRICLTKEELVKLLENLERRYNERN